MTCVSVPKTERDASTPYFDHGVRVTREYRVRTQGDRRPKQWIEMLRERRETLAPQSTLEWQSLTRLALGPGTPFPTGTRLTLHNIVSIINMSWNLELSILARFCRNTAFNLMRFNAVIMRIRDPKTTGFWHTARRILWVQKGLKNVNLLLENSAELFRNKGLMLSFMSGKL
jgi:hypothetical protein